MNKENAEKEVGIGASFFAYVGMKSLTIRSRNVIEKKMDGMRKDVAEAGRRRTLGMKGFVLMLTTWLLLLTGCSRVEGERVRDLDGVIVSEEALPAELKEIIDGKKEQAFQLTYSDEDYLYICIGYGKQETGGYSIALNDLYLTETEVRVYPYLVIRTELVKQPVVFQ